MAVRDDFKKKPEPKPVPVDDFGIPIKKSKSSFLNKLLVFVAAFVLIMSLSIMAIYYFQIYMSHKSYDKYSDLYSDLTTDSETPKQDEIKDDSPLPLLPLAEELLAKNPDTVGWVNVPNTHISYPVVLRKDDENQFYLKHDFDGKNSNAGAVFIDYRSTIESRKQSDNLILYAHNESNNTMFGDLDLYKMHNKYNWGEAALNFYKQNPVFYFDTNYEKQTYKIFAIFVTETKQENDPSHNLFEYNNYIDFADKDRYDEFINQINLRNKYLNNIDCQYGDSFVTLSTCSNETNSSRLVLIGRKVRPGESPDVDISSIKLNPNAHEPNWNAIYNR